MGTLVDSSILIAAERGDVDLEPRLRNDEHANVAIAAITVSEVLHGVQRMRGVRRARAERIADQMVSALPVIPFGLEIARVHATLAAELGRRGAQVGAHDLMIAATAVWLGYDVATKDRRSFSRIKGLDVTYW